jgi:hypothetical protein
MHRQATSNSINNQQQHQQQQQTHNKSKAVDLKR